MARGVPQLNLPFPRPGLLAPAFQCQQIQPGIKPARETGRRAIRSDRAMTVDAGFYKEWKGKFKPEMWAAPEQEAGQSL
jgi:hypothetical protein